MAYILLHFLTLLHSFLLKPALCYPAVMLLCFTLLCFITHLFSLIFFKRRGYTIGGFGIEYGNGKFGSIITSRWCWKKKKKIEKNILPLSPSCFFLKYTYNCIATLSKFCPRSCKLSFQFSWKKYFLNLILMNSQ